MKKYIIAIFIIIAFLNTKAQIFSTKNIISSNISNPEVVISADFNNDGYIDVVFSTIADHKIAISLFDNATGTFAEQQIITTAFTYAVSLFPADLDGDNNIDLLLVSQLTNKVGWYKNDGAGNFTLQTLINDDAQGVSSVIAADIDGDTDLDVVSCAKSDNKILWYENDGSGNFSAPNEITTNAEIPVVIISADIDNDNDQDIIAGYAQTDKIVSFINDGTGTFSTANEITAQTDYIYSIKAGDFNDDGKIDIVSASKNDNKLAWYKNLGNGNFSSQIAISTDIPLAFCVDIADLDLDNDIDIICTSQGGDKIFIFKNTDGNGTFEEYLVINKEAEGAKGISIADFDNDGDYDFVVALNIGIDEIAWFENGKANFLVHNINNNRDITSIDTYDVNGDGNADIFYSDADGIYVVGNFNAGESFSQEVVMHSGAANISKIKLIDIDNDGDKDLFCADGLGDNVFWFRNNGGGNFSSQIIIDNVGDGPSSLINADYDSDGDLDILVANFDKIVIYNNTDGNGTFNKIIVSDTVRAFSLAFCDINNDNHKDIVFSEYDYVAAYINDGAGNYTTSVILDNTVSYANNMISADFNNDTYDDFTFTPSHDVYWFENNQNSTFQKHDLSYYGDFIDIGDIDNDGDIDILSSYRIGGTVHILENINYGDNFHENLPFYVEDARVIKVEDINNDGYTDIVIGTWPRESINWAENYQFRIIYHPFDQYVCENNSAYFSVISTGVKNYQWQKLSGANFVNLTNDATYSGTDKAQLKISSVTSDMFGNEFRCLIYDKRNLEQITDTATLNQFTASIQCISNQIRTADNSNVYTVAGTEFDLDTIFNKCDETLTAVNDYNNSATLAGETLSPGTYTIKWEIKNTSNQVIDDCTFDIEIKNYVGINKISENNIFISPNPTNGILNVNFSKVSNFGKVEIINITGKTVKQLSINSNQLSIDLTNQPAGIYFIKVQTNKGLFINKIIKN